MSCCCSKFEILPLWFENVLGCKKNGKQETSKPKPKLSLEGDLFQKFKFETRKKSLSEKFTESIDKAFAYAQRLILPEKYVLPCLLGDCDMDKKIQKEKEQYSNIFHKKVPLAPPEHQGPDETTQTPTSSLGPNET